MQDPPIAGPQFQSALNASCSSLQVLGSPTCPCKFLKTLVMHTLKRLASAVQLRPWPPFFNHLAILLLSAFCGFVRSRRKMPFREIFRLQYKIAPPLCSLGF
jgi:hypothetical protein